MPQPSPGGALQAVAAQANTVQQKRHPPEQRQQDHHRANWSTLRARAPPAPSVLGEASEGAAEAPSDKILGEAAEGAVEALSDKCCVSLSVTIRGGRTTVSEALSTRSR